MIKRSVSAAIALATTTFGFAAFAQQAGVAADGTAAVGTGTTGAVTAEATPAPAPAPMAAPAPAPAPAPAAAPLPDAPAGESDHDAMAGRLALGYLGFVNMPYGAIGNPGANTPATTATAPIIGMRFWLSSALGIDAGLGITTTFGTQKTEVAGASTTVNATAPTGLGVHFGMPIALHSAKHYSFQIIPETNITYAQQAISAPPGGGTAIDHSGIHFDLGARAGAELHFGFIGVPELSLVGSVGLRASINSTKTESTATATGTVTTVSDTRTVIETTVGNNPWDIFAGSISAFYYL